MTKEEELDALIEKARQLIGRLSEERAAVRALRGRLLSDAQMQVAVITLLEKSRSRLKPADITALKTADTAVANDSYNPAAKMARLLAEQPSEADLRRNRP